MEAPIHLTRPSEVRQYLKAIGFSPTKSLGQNFLVDRNIRDLIVDASGVEAGDQVVEIGPGLGVMTEGLLERGAQVHAVEIDHRLVAHLQKQFPEQADRLRVSAADATKVDWPAIFGDAARVRIVSNLPYSVGSRVLYDLAAPALAPASITVMVQSDVADRLIAQPGSEDWGVLGVRMSLLYEARRVREVPGSCFIPAPRVGSAVVHLTRRPAPAVELADPDRFEAIVKFAFTRRRKQLGSILRDCPFSCAVAREQFEEAGVRLSVRPAELSLCEWASITHICLAEPPPDC